MISSYLLRFFLLAMLPAVAIAIYLAGQNYEEALIDLNADNKSHLLSCFSVTIDQYDRTGEVSLFTKENLYEYINGHAEYFIGAGFVNLLVGEYVSRGSEAATPDVVVDVYDMGKGIHALGVLLDESGGRFSDLGNGISGFKTDSGILFIKGRFYIKVTAFKKSVPVMQFAQGFAKKIGGGSEAVPVFSFLSDLGVHLKTTYIKEGYRGLSFVNNVIEMEYSIEEKPVRFFVVKSSSTEISNLKSNYIDFFNNENIYYTSVINNGTEFYRINDLYEGQWYLIPGNEVMYGLYGEVSEETEREIVKRIGKQL